MTRWLNLLPLAVLLAGPALVTGCNKSTTTEPAPCTSDTMCAANESCKDGKCVAKGCMLDTECPPGQKCAEGKCIVPERTCAASSDCIAGTVCRSMKCVAVPCSMTMACMAGESCKDGKCGPETAKGTPGRTLAAGGGVSKSEKHIHVSLTGQGRAVGTGSNAAHNHTGGGTAVMQR